MSSSQTQKYDPIFHFESWISGIASPTDFYRILPMFQKFSEHIRLRQCILYHKGDFSSVIQKISTSPKVVLTNYSSLPWLFEVKTNPKDNVAPLRGLLAIIPGKFPNMFRAVTVSKSDLWLQLIRRLIRRAYPEAMRVFFKQDEIRKALEVMENQIGDNFRVHILDATLKAKRDAGINQGRPRFNTDRVWRDQSIAEIFEEALEKNQWFTSLTFALQKRVNKQEKFLTIATGRISKFGEISSDFLFNEIEENIISVLEGFASERLELYQSRGIRERNFEPSPPLEIQYDIDIFEDVEEIRRFGRAMIGYPDSSIAVFHGNPYYHASIADFADGSSFDIWILSPNRILIAPQAKSSPQALERITAYIFYEFREGVVKEYAES